MYWTYGVEDECSGDDGCDEFTNFYTCTDPEGDIHTDLTCEWIVATGTPVESVPSILGVLESDMVGIIGQGVAVAYTEASGWVGSLEQLKYGQYYTFILTDDSPNYDIATSLGNPEGIIFENEGTYPNPLHAGNPASPRYWKNIISPETPLEFRTGIHYEIQETSNKPEFDDTGQLEGYSPVGIYWLGLNPLHVKDFVFTSRYLDSAYLSLDTNWPEDGWNSPEIILSSGPNYYDPTPPSSRDNPTEEQEACHEDPTMFYDVDDGECRKKRFQKFKVEPKVLPNGTITKQVRIQTKVFESDQIELGGWILLVFKDLPEGGVPASEIFKDVSELEFNSDNGWQYLVKSYDEETFYLYEPHWDYYVNHPPQGGPIPADIQQLYQNFIIESGFIDTQLVIDEDDRQEWLTLNDLSRATITEKIINGIEVTGDDVYREYYPVLPKLTFNGKFDTYEETNDGELIWDNGLGYQSYGEVYGHVDDVLNNTPKSTFGSINRKWDENDTYSYMTRFVVTDTDLLLDLNFSEVDNDMLDDNSGNLCKGVLISDYEVLFERETKKPERNDFIIFPGTNNTKNPY